jgi:hypothetical protein
MLWGMSCSALIRRSESSTLTMRAAFKFTSHREAAANFGRDATGSDTVREVQEDGAAPVHEG